MPHFPSIPVVVRNISVYVLEGKDLAAKDSGFFFRTAESSDPYYIVKFKKLSIKSEVQKQTLNPVWSRRVVDMGSIKAGETEVLEITLFDRDLMTRDDFMGVVKVTAGELLTLDLGEHKLWFELNKSTEERYANEAVSGEILVEIIVKVRELP